jgi:hypothetical protein
MLVTNPWKQEDGDAFAKHFAKRLSATTNPVVEIFNYEPGVSYPRPEAGHVMKVKFQVRRRKIDMEISIVFSVNCEFRADISAYARMLGNEHWESLECSCEHKDALSSSYLRELNSAIYRESKTQAEEAYDV